MAKRKLQVVEFKSASYYAEWVIRSLGNYADLEPYQLEGAKGQNYIEWMVGKMRKDSKLNPMTWERRYLRAQVDRTQEPIPYYLLQAFVACAYAVRTEMEDKLPQPNRAWDHAVAAAWWCGVFGGGMNRFDQLKAVRDATSKKAAAVRHAENRQMKAEARAWYDSRRDSMSKDAAAEAMAKVVLPVPFRTIRNWLTDPAKDKN